MLSINDCYNICNQNDAFYAKEFRIDGVKFVVFNYRLAWYKDFLEIPGSEELRGLTFNLETGERFWSIHKTFNVGETDSLSVDKISNKCSELVVEDKVDGSLIQFIPVNGEFVPKTKATFYNEQSLLAKYFIDDNLNYKTFIRECYNADIQPIFELLSPKNQVVVYYPETTLILTQIRDYYGNYLDLDGRFLKSLILKHNVNCVQKQIKNLKNLLTLKQQLSNCEGWVISNPNNLNEKWKLKTDWYLSLHRVVSDHTIRANAVIHSLVDETLDDAITILQDSPKKKSITDIAVCVETWFNKTVNDIVNILSRREKFANRKSFAIRYKNLPYFGIIMLSYNDTYIDDQKIMERLKIWVKKRTRTETLANSFLDNIKGIAIC